MGDSNKKLVFELLKRLLKLDSSLTMELQGENRMDNPGTVEINIGKDDFKLDFKLQLHLNIPVVTFVENNGIPISESVKSQGGIQIGMILHRFQGKKPNENILQIISEMLTSKIRPLNIVLTRPDNHEEYDAVRKVLMPEKAMFNHLKGHPSGVKILMRNALILGVNELVLKLISQKPMPHDDLINEIVKKKRKDFSEMVLKLKGEETTLIAASKRTKDAKKSVILNKKAIMVHNQVLGLGKGL
mgnify:CR=1 FL=1